MSRCDVGHVAASVAYGSSNGGFPVVALTCVFAFPLIDVPPTVPMLSAVMASLFPATRMDCGSDELLKMPHPVTLMLRLFLVVDMTVPVVPSASMHCPPPLTIATARPQILTSPEDQILENVRVTDCVMATSVAPVRAYILRSSITLPCRRSIHCHHDAVGPIDKTVVGGGHRFCL